MTAPFGIAVAVALIADDPELLRLLRLDSADASRAYRTHFDPRVVTKLLTDTMAQYNSPGCIRGQDASQKNMRQSLLQLTVWRSFDRQELPLGM